MSQVTEALRNILQGYVMGTPAGKSMAEAQQRQQELEQAKEFHQQSLDLENKRLQEEQRVHDAEIAYRQGELKREQMLAKLARTKTMADLSSLSPEALARIPGASQVTTNETIPGTEIYSGKQGLSTTLPGLEDEQGQPLSIQTGSQADYLKNLAETERAKRAPETEIAQARMEMLQKQMEENYQRAIQVANIQSGSREEVANANREARMYETLYRGLFGMDIAKLKLGLTGDTDSEVQQYLDRIKHGEIGQSDLKKELSTRPAIYNLVTSGANKAGLSQLTDRQRDLVGNFGNAAEALRQMQEYNQYRKQNGVGMGTLADLSQKQASIKQNLATVERNLLNTRLSNQQAGYMTGAYLPDILSVKAGLQSIAGGKDTQAVNEQRQQDFAKYMHGLIEQHLSNLSPEQKQAILERTGINQYLPPYVGEVVDYQGKRVRITKIKGQKFDYEEVKP